MTDKADATTAEETVSVEVKLPRVVAELLAVLDRDVAHLPRPAAAKRPPPPAPEDWLALSDDDREALDRQFQESFRLDHAPRAETLEQRCARVLLQLADHAQQGVHRNGGWERQWITQAFGDGWLERTEPGDPDQRLFRRPKR
jgi:hypothetical protein